MVGHSAHRDIFSNSRDAKGDAESLQCVEMLLDAGARWNPPLEELRHARRGLLDHDDKHIVQLLRLLLYTPDAANFDILLELCRSQTLKARVGTVDAHQVGELQALRKTRRVVSGGDASTNTEMAPVVVAHTPAV